MFMFDIWFSALIIICMAGLLFWAYSVLRQNVSIVDMLWSLMFLIAALTYANGVELLTDRAIVVLTLVGLWSIRLSAYIAWRNHGEPEDHRYQTIRANNQPGFWWKSIYIVFGLQGLLAWIISLPLLGAITSPAPLNPLDYLGMLLWSAGFFFESVSDWQLARFRRSPLNRDKVFDRGLWRYSRHPNYFGNACIWWGFFLMAFAAGGWWSIVSPVLMTVLLLKVSGVALLENTIRRRRPEYAEYVKRTNAFIPGPPRMVRSS